jgi:hypothetical protein
MKNSVPAFSLGSGGSNFSEADIQIEGLQWSGMYFGNAALVDSRDLQLYGYPIFLQSDAVRGVQQRALKRA